MEVGGDRDGRTQNLYRLPVFQAALCPERQPSVHASGRGPLCPSAAEKPPFRDTGLPVLPGEDGQVALAACCGVPTRRGRFRAPARAKGRIPPPFSFRLAEKKSAVDGVKEKGALNPVRLDHSTGFPAAFAVTSPPTAPGPALSAPLSATWAGIGAGSSGSQHREILPESGAGVGGRSG